MYKLFDEKKIDYILYKIFRYKILYDTICFNNFIDVMGIKFKIRDIEKEIDKIIDYNESIKKHYNIKNEIVKFGSFIDDITGLIMEYNDINNIYDEKKLDDIKFSIDFNFFTFQTEIKKEVLSLLRYKKDSLILLKYFTKKGFLRTTYINQKKTHFKMLNSID